MLLGLKLAFVRRSRPGLGGAFRRLAYYVISAFCAIFAVCAIGAPVFEVETGLQVAPGKVDVTISVPGEAPKPDEVVLRLDGQRDVPASEIRALPPAPPPAWLVICIDRSGSMSPQAVQDIKRAITTSLSADARGAAPYKVAVLSFASDLLQAGGAKFHSRPADIEAAVSALQREGNPKGRTRLFDTVSAALADLRGKEGGRRVIIVSDGKDEGSQLGLAELKRLLGNDGLSVPIDTIAYGVESERFAGALSELAGITGGRSESAGTSAELSEALAATLRSTLVQRPRYVASFSYAVGAPGRNATSRDVVFKRAGVGPVSARLDAPVQAPLLTVGGEAKPTGSCTDGPWLCWADRVIKLFEELPGVIKVIVALLSALSVFFVGKKIVTVMKTRHIWIFPWVEVEKPETTPPKTEDRTVTPPPAENTRRRTGIGYTWPSPGGGRAIAALRAVGGSVRGKVYSMDKAVYSIGASEENDLVLVGDEYASARHAKLRYEAGSLYIQDLGSTNGSTLNGQPFKGETRGLSPGDTLRLGHSTFEVLEPKGSPA